MDSPPTSLHIQTRVALETIFNTEPDFGVPYYSRQIFLWRMFCFLREEHKPRSTVLVLQLPSDTGSHGHTRVICTHEKDGMLLPSTMVETHFRAAHFDGTVTSRVMCRTMRMNLVSAALEIPTCNFLALIEY